MLKKSNIVPFRARKTDKTTGSKNTNSEDKKNLQTQAYTNYENLFDESDNRGEEDQEEEEDDEEEDDEEEDDDYDDDDDENDADEDSPSGDEDEDGDPYSSPTVPDQPDDVDIDLGYGSDDGGIDDDDDGDTPGILGSALIQNPVVFYRGLSTDLEIDSYCSQVIGGL